MAGRLILVVEDEAEMAAFLKERLRAKGYEVAVADCAAVALASFTERPPDLVILDVGLPDLTGYELCKRFREKESAKRTPILMLTAKGRPIDKFHGFDYGTDAYLTKPFDLAELEQTIVMLLER